MVWLSKQRETREGDWVQLIGPRYKTYILKLSRGEQLHTNVGVLEHDDLIGLAWGTPVFTHSGNRFLLVQPALDKLLLNTPRRTQIMYPKDIGLILVSMGIGPGCQVIEAGTGSGAMTATLAFAVGSQGRVYSYEINPDYQALAAQNLARLGLEQQVVFHTQDIGAGFQEAGVDAVFLDLPDPENYVSQSRHALKPGGFFGCLLPTTNQVSRLVKALKGDLFDAVEVCESLVRNYKPVPNRFRPVDRMVAHTGFLIFARRILPVPEGTPPEKDSLQDAAEPPPFPADAHKPQAGGME